MGGSDQEADVVARGWIVFVLPFFIPASFFFPVFDFAIRFLAILYDCCEPLHSSQTLANGTVSNIKSNTPHETRLQSGKSASIPNKSAESRYGMGWNLSRRRLLHMIYKPFRPIPHPMLNPIESPMSKNPENKTHSTRNSNADARIASRRRCNQAVAQALI